VLEGARHMSLYPNTVYTGKVNMELQLDATITVLLISMISSTCFGQIKFTVYTFVYLAAQRLISLSYWAFEAIRTH
jgi:hypothetical protein